MDPLIIGIGEHDEWRGGDYGDDGSDGDDEEEEENDEEPYDDYDEDAAWNLPTVGKSEAEARDAEDRVWDARIMSDFNLLMDSMTDNFSSLLRRPRDREDDEDGRGIGNGGQVEFR